MKVRLFGILTLLLSSLSLSALGQGDFQKGISYYKQGQYAKAVQEFEQIVKQSPDYEAGYLVLGDSYLKLRQFEKAAQSFHKAIDLEGGKFVSYRGAAVAEYNLGRYQDVIATLLKAEGLAGTAREKYQLFQLRGSAYYSLGRFRPAVRDLEQATSVQRTDKTALLQLGISYYQLKEFDRAKTTLQQVLGLDPDLAEAKRFLSRLDYQEALDAIREQRYQEAASQLTRVVQASPTDGEAWFNLGLAQLFSEDVDGALKSFLQSAQLLPENWETHDRLGFIFETKGQYAAALQSYKKAAELNPGGTSPESVSRVEERIRRQREGT
ncbi:MAG: tetratricopeptide repeat protein [Acidobacteriota bacterium]|nr:MAG: tetratricopeptide repeat protein [Acidobacteriota bacterium]